jgi:hypothetical protein
VLRVGHAFIPQELWREVGVFGAALPP